MAFGDSLTWGSRPDGLGRHAPGDRWPDVLEAGLPGVAVIAEGLRGRTTAFDRQASSCDTNGARILPVLLHTHAPLDAVVVMLGTNDLWEDHPLSRVRDGLMRVVEVIQHHAYRLPRPHRPGILLVAPPPMVATGDPFVTPAKIAASEAYPEIVAGVAEAQRLPWFDAGRVAAASPRDGVHLEADATRAIGEALRGPVAELLAARRRAGAE